MFCVCPEVHSRAFFLTIVVVQNVSLRTTGSSMATGCDVAESDVTGSDVTGSDVIRLKVDDCPWGVILIVRGVVWYSKCVFYHVGVLTVVFLLNNLRAADRGQYAAAATADRDIHRRQKDMCRRCHSSSNTQSNVGEPYYILKTNNPFLFWVPDGYDPDHFMPWVHPFTSVIAGPTGSEKSMFVQRFVHNIKHMMTLKPDRILRCYGEYQTLYGTVEGIEFQQG